MATQRTDPPIRIGTRGSPLALAQAEEVRDRLMAAHNLDADAFEITVLKTTGDAVQDRPLSEIGGKGLFTKELEVALFQGDVDIAVHSMKDVATRPPEELTLDVILEREDVRDAFISHRHARFEDLPEGAILGTSSLRRRAQALHRRPDLRVVEFRGNVQTRLKKLEDGIAEATFLACAGLRRLGQTDLAANAIAEDQMPPAAAQGAVGVQRRADDDRAAEIIAPLNHPATATRVAMERAFLDGLDGSCRTPIACLATLNGDRVEFYGEILRPNGSERHNTRREGLVSDAIAMGADAARELRDRAGPGFFDE